MSHISRRNFLVGSSALVGASLLNKNISFANEKAPSMDTLEAIATRRSVRSYTDQKVSEEQIQTILKAAMQAPSAHNKQPWEFVVVTEKEKIANVTPNIAKYAPYAKNAPLAILTCYDSQKEKSIAYGMQDLGAVNQNILLAVHALGLGAVWTGVTPEDEKEVAAWKEYFKLPAHIIPVSYVLIGYAKKQPEQKYYYAEAKVHRNEW